MKKEQARIRRGLKAKAIIRASGKPCIKICKTGKHIYSQITVYEEGRGDIVLASCSTRDKEIRDTLKGTKTEKSYQIGKILAERAKKAEISDVAFDRCGYKYHGHVKSLATGAREAGLNF